MILVTGGSGPLGLVLVEMLIRQGQKVRVFDIVRSPDMNSKAEFMEGDISKLDDVMRASKGCNYILHLATIQPDPKRPRSDYEKINIGGTENVLKAAVELKVKRTVFVSSCHIFGPGDGTPITEESPVSIHENYGWSKYESEKLCWEYRERYNISVSVIRPNGIFGPRLPNTQAIRDQYRAILDNKAIQLIGDGSLRHAGTAASDVAKAIILAMEKPEADGEAFNIVCDREGAATDRAISQALIEHSGSSSKITSVPTFIVKIALFFIEKLSPKMLYPDPVLTRKVAPIDFLFDISKAKRVLGYKPEKGMIDAHIESFEWYRDNVYNMPQPEEKPEPVHRVKKKMAVMTLVSLVLGVLAAFLLYRINVEAKIRVLMGICAIIPLIPGALQMLASREKLKITNFESFRMAKEGGVNTFMMGLFYSLPVFDVQRFIVVLFLSSFSKLLIYLNFSQLKLKENAPWFIFYGAVMDLFLAVLTLSFAFQYLGLL